MKNNTILCPGYDQIWLILYYHMIFHLKNAGFQYENNIQPFVGNNPIYRDQKWTIWTTDTGYAEYTNWRKGDDIIRVFFLEGTLEKYGLCWRYA